MSRREDRDALMRLGPRTVINTIGPFQTADYTLAEACIAAGVHYIDLADSHTFVAGITRLDAAAKAKNVAVISGASTVPALSGAVLAQSGLTPLAVRIGICPGNRAPRGASLVAAIMAQAGKPLPIWRGGAWTTIPGWGGLHRRRIRTDRNRTLGRRWLSACDAPDLVLLPRRYPTVKSVQFYAGMELALLHLGLWALSLPVRAGVVRSLSPLANPLRWIADRLVRFGSDRGGMLVDVGGLDANGAYASYRWRLIVGDGEGPFIPAAPAVALIQRLVRGETLTPGAYPCLGILSVAEILAVVGHLPVHTRGKMKRRPSLFAAAMASEFTALPDPIRTIHDRARCFSASGQCDIDEGRNPIARLIAALFRLPRAGRDLPVTVKFLTRGGCEIWERRFGDSLMRSVLRRAERPGHVVERFGPASFTIHLRRDGARLHYDVVAGRFLGIPLPKALLPRSETSETVADGVFRFDVCLSLPLVGLLAHYRGWLKPDALISDATLGDATPDRG